MQVFETVNKKRWTRFKWSFRAVIFLALMSASVLTIALVKQYTPSVPSLLTNRADASNLLFSTHAAEKSKLVKKYQGFRRYMNEHYKKTLKQQGTAAPESVYKRSQTSYTYKTKWRQSSGIKLWHCTYRRQLCCMHRC